MTLLTLFAVTGTAPTVATAYSQRPTVGLSRATVGTRASAGALVWADEFSGPAGAAPDPAKWEIVTTPSGQWNSELECYTSSSQNVRQNGAGYLVITARVGSGSCPYTSARLQTKGLFQTEYGTIEARMRLPAGQGLWPAFWALGSNEPSAGWPQCGEIDVMENLGSNPFVAYGSIHGPWGTAVNGYGYTTSYRNPVSLTGGFHTYAVTWTPTSISYSLDGVIYAKYTPATLRSGQSWVFKHPFYLLLNLAVGGSWPGPPNSRTMFPARLLVNWVRVYS